MFAAVAYRFQSSPAINCGRHPRNAKGPKGNACFNPHPRSTAGVTPTALEPRRCFSGFNPHPRSTAGVTTIFASRLLGSQVSILTRDQLRASHVQFSDRVREKEFQSSPAINCGRHRPNQCPRWSILQFQSSPAINCGRHLMLLDKEREDLVFQSSPAINCGRHLTPTLNRG